MRRGRCCCDCVCRVRAVTCAGAPFEAGIVVAYYGDGFAETAEAFPEAASPYWATFRGISGPALFVPGGDSACETGLPTPIDPVECGGEYSCVFVCHRPIYKLAPGFSCVKPAFQVFSPHDMEFVDVDGGGYHRFRVTGVDPYVLVGDVHRKLGPLVKVPAPATPCPDPAASTILSAPSMSLLSGWDCCPWIDDGVGRTALSVSTMIGDATVSGTFCSNPGLVVTASLPHCVVDHGEEECGGKSVRQYPIFGSADVRVGFDWNVSGPTPVAYQRIRHETGIRSPSWWPTCAKVDAERLYANARRTGYWDPAVDMLSFPADRYTIHSQSSPASITFEWDEVVGIYDPELAADYVPGGSPVPGSITITEKMT